MKKALLVPVLVLSVFGCAPADTAQPGGARTGGTTGSGSGGTLGSSGGTSAGSGGVDATTTGGSNGNSGGSIGSSGGASADSGGTTGSSGGSGVGSGGSTGSPGGSGGGSISTGGRGGGPVMGGASGSSGGATGSLLDVAKPLNGQMLLGPCVVDRLTSVCHTVPLGATCPTNADRALSGVLTTDKTIKLGGTMGQPYTITLHVQGEVESKQYTGGVDQNSTAQTPKADGFCVGGTPTTATDYNVYMIRVTNPGSTTHTDYFLNSLQGPGVSNHTTYGVDYTTGPIKAQGGASIRLVAGDSNCDMIKNCGPTVNNGSVCAAPIIMQNIDPEALTSNPSFNFNTAYNGQWLTMVVKTVTSP